MPYPQESPLVDRERELRELRALAAGGSPALALLYGRRRVGKTYLLDHAWPDQRTFYFLAGDTTPEVNKRDLLRELAPLLAEPADADPALYPSWRHVFRAFADLAEEAPFVVVLDEFQHLLEQDEDVASQLMAVWDREVKGRPLVLVACGSEVGLMERLASGAGPLYGRWTWAARLRAFDFFDAARMTPERSLREKATIYGAFGGTPRYLATIDGGDRLSTRVVESLLSPRGEVHLQLANLLEQERGIRNVAEYRAVLMAIAGGATHLPEIAQAAGLDDRVHAVRRVVEVLESLELVRRERNFDASPKAPFRHRISDPAVRFWYRFVAPNRSRLETGDPAEVWRHHVEPHLAAYLGKVFEDMVREAFVRHHAAWGLPAARDWARWEGQDRNRRSIEVDIVSRLDDGRLLTGEVKWSSRPVDTSVHRDLLRDLEDLGRSGQGWARDALDPEASAGHLYVSAAGFTEEMEQVARDDERVCLVTLEDLYGVAR